MLLLCDIRQQRKGQSDAMESDVEMYIMERCETEFLHAEKMAPIDNDIHQLLLNIYGDQTVDMSTVRWWVVHFSSDNSSMKDKLCSGQPCRFLQACRFQFIAGENALLVVP